MRVAATFLAAAAAQVTVLGARSVAEAIVGAAPAVDGALAAAGLFACALGALLRLSPRVVAALLAVAGTAVLVVGVVGTTPLVTAAALVPAAARIPAVALALAMLALPFGALVPALAATGVPATSAYRADLAGACVGAASAGAVAAAVGLATLGAAAVVLAAIAAAIFGIQRASASSPAGSATSSSTVPPAGSGVGSAWLVYAGVAVASAAVGVVEVEIPRAFAAATAASPDALAAAIAGCLGGGALGVSVLPRRFPAAVLLVAGAVSTAALVALLPTLRSGLLWCLSDTAVPAFARAVVGFALLAISAAPAAFFSGGILGRALPQSTRTSLAVSAAAAGVACIASVTVLAGLQPERQIAAAAFVALAAAVPGATSWRILVAAPVAGVALLAAALLVPHGDLATFDLSRALLTGVRAPSPSAVPRVVVDAVDATGRTVVTVGDDEVLYKDGKADASLLGDVDTETFLALLPLVYAPDASSAFVVGLGSGTTARVLSEAGVAHVDVAEISPVVIAATSVPAGVRVLPGDARVVGLDGRYDIVTAEPTNLFASGTAHLYTKEALAGYAARLNRGGVVVVWLHGYLASPDLVRMIARTARSVFASVDVYAGRTSDLFLVGRKSAAPVDPATLAARLGPRGACALHAVGHADVAALLRRRTRIDETSDATAGPVHEDVAPHAIPLARRALLDATVLASPSFLPAGEPVEALLDTAGARSVDPLSLGVALEARRSEPLSTREVIALLESAVGRDAVLAHASDLAVAPVGLDPPWAPALARAALTLTLSPRADAASVVAALLALDVPGCSTGADWDLAVAVAKESARRDKNARGRIAGALASVAVPARERSRLLLAASLCTEAHDASCCASLRARLAPYGESVDAQCGVLPALGATNATNGAAQPREQSAKPVSATDGSSAPAASPP